eukprot:3151708-Pyramimonas_sp.AAC.1
MFLSSPPCVPGPGPFTVTTKTQSGGLGFFARNKMSSVNAPPRNPTCDDSRFQVRYVHPNTLRFPVGECGNPVRGTEHQQRTTAYTNEMTTWRN